MSFFSTFTKILVIGITVHLVTTAYIDPQVFLKTNPDVLITFSDRLKDVDDKMMSQKYSSTSEFRYNYMTALKQRAATSQQNVIQILIDNGANFISYWLVNAICVFGISPSLLIFFLGVEYISIIIAPVFPIITPIAKPDCTKELGIDGIYGQVLIGADKFWKMGINGAGVRVANIDTGVYGDHPVFEKSYRWLGLGNPICGWFDGYSNSNGGEAPTDSDAQYGHGTHTAGTCFGNGTGVAPGASWAACRGCQGTTCFNCAIFNCMQWAFCPTPTGRCTCYPQVVSNSYGGTGNSTTFEDAIARLWFAGTFMIFAAGNSGSACSTMSSPGDSPNVTGVAACDGNGTVASFSSRGASYTNKTGLSGASLKPDVTAAGVKVSSSVNKAACLGYLYAYLSGTSMATPHIAGGIALLIQAFPKAPLSTIAKLFITSSISSGMSCPTSATSPPDCNGTSNSAPINYCWGYGLANVDAAARKLCANNQISTLYNCSMSS